MSLLRYRPGAGPRRHLAWRDTDKWLPRARAWATVLVAPLIAKDRTGRWLR
jgi:hypothetical protein